MYKCYSVVLYEEVTCLKYGCVEFKETGEVLDSLEEHKGKLYSLGMTRQYAGLYDRSAVSLPLRR